MRHLIGVICAGGLLTLSLFGTATAGPFEDGEQAYDHGDYAVAIEFWRPLADSGDARAQYMLGLSYDLGHGVRRDLGQAAKWYQQAADQGVERARANLGTMYANGESVPENYFEAIKWWRDAID